MGRKERERLEHHAMVDLTKPETNKPIRPRGFKKFVRYMLDPVRLVVGMVFSLLYCQIVNHTVTEGKFWLFFLAFSLGSAVYYGLRAAREWAGSPKSGD